MTQMIVSPNLGSFTIATSRKKRSSCKAVSLSVPGNDIEYKQPAQLPTFNIGKKIMKPGVCVEPPVFKGVPLKSLQQYSHAEGAMLFDAPVLLIPEPLKVVVPSSAKIDYDAMLEDYQIPFYLPFDYNLGIRPQARAIKIDSVKEPANPFPTRPALVAAPAKVQTGTYRIGSRDYNILGF
jgi:hypothetical protein